MYNANISDTGRIIILFINLKYTKR